MKSMKIPKYCPKYGLCIGTVSQVSLYDSCIKTFLFNFDSLIHRRIKLFRITEYLI